MSKTKQNLTDVANDIVNSAAVADTATELTPLQKMTTSQLFDRDAEKWDEESLEEAAARIEKILIRFRKARIDDIPPPPEPDKPKKKTKKSKEPFNHSDPLETKI